MIPALRALGSAFAYYTVLPVGSRRSGESPGPATLAWLPLIGGVVGAIAGCVGYAASAYLHAPWSFALAWSVAIVLTGAIHVDGFLDACDGLFATASPERRREILKDPHHGTFAIAGMAIAAALWLAALAAIAPARYPLILAFSGAAARLAVIPNAWLFPYPPTGSMAATFARRPNVVAMLLNIALVEALAWLVSPWALALPPAAMLLACAAAAWSNRRLGGTLTGDVYGAVIVALEVPLLLAIGIISPK